MFLNPDPHSNKIALAATVGARDRWVYPNDLALTFNREDTLDRVFGNQIELGSRVWAQVGDTTDKLPKFGKGLEKDPLQALMIKNEKETITFWTELPNGDLYVEVEDQNIRAFRLGH